MITKSRISKAQPDAGSVYVVPELGTMSVGFMQNPADFVAPQVFPAIQVKQQAGKYPLYPRGYFFRDEMKKRADGAPSQGSGFAVEYDEFYCDVWAWHTKQGPQVRANARHVDLDRAAVELMSHKALISLEKEWVTNFFANNIWTTELVSHATPTGSQILTWDDDAALPIKDMKTARRTMKQLTGYRPNTAVFSADAWDRFTEHPNVLNRINQGQTSGIAEITKEQVGALIGVKILVAEGIETTTEEGQTEDFDFIVPTGLWMGYVAPNPGLFVPSAGYRFDWTGYLGGAGPQGQVVSRWYEQKEKAHYYEIEQARDQHLVSADMGIWFKDLFTAAS